MAAPGSFAFEYEDIVALVAERPRYFEARHVKSLPTKVRKYIDRIPIVSPSYSYEDVVEAISNKLQRARAELEAPPIVRASKRRT